MEREYLKECYVIRVYHHNALSVWSKIDWNAEFSLERKSVEDGYSEDKVVVGVKPTDNNGTCTTIIGELSKDDSKDLLIYLKQGWNYIFSAFICYKNDSIADEDKRLKAVIYVNIKGQESRQSNVQQVQKTGGHSTI